jgi:hypothetical protein
MLPQPSPVRRTTSRITRTPALQMGQETRTTLRPGGDRTGRHLGDHRCEGDKSQGRSTASGNAFCTPGPVW